MSDLTAPAFRELHKQLRAANAWADPERGALAALTRARVAAAAALVRSGRTVALGAPVETAAGPDNPDPAEHRMTALPTGVGLSFARDRFAMNVHGDVDSHLDALCHVSYDGTLYGGVPATAVTAAGATALTVDVLGGALAGRGVLLDIPRLRGTPWLEPGSCVSADDLRAAESAQRVRVTEGDLLLVRTGHRRRREALGCSPARAGLHPRALEFAAERRVAVLGSDGNSDAAPSPAAGVAYPVHVLAVQAMGLHLLDYLALEELARVCAQEDRWAFLCVVAPLRLPGATGSPVNPVALF
ncbi:kynurenine formamidase [Kitasatospora sp. MAA4]|uniref:cyclase family protein n=1 Tax=Kitasatospora sp. MAA4 TaxID=3035093 RepID=UPI00247334C4|nr:cyclase family protein [Kitasatospora sp. MAA4]MDH6135695.1 kynurenine formamidase [Kitasatospora sp. MAA4]